ncbi:MAG: rhodanese-like domain-containing protein [Desulfuromonadaceae bacterium]|nr:rhodanese-like domain-containing protein [Desulfuromonadaceae bacterium]
MSKKLYGLLMLAMVSLVLGGCGSSSESKVSAVASLKPAMTDFPNSGLLVSADSLQSSLGAPKLIVVDTRPTAAYEAGHIPGAINVHWQDYRDGVALALKPLATLESQLSTVGIFRDATIVIYDDTIYSWGAAGRIFWMLDVLGCDDIHILNGGWNKWQADGRTTHTGAVTLPAANFKAADTLREGISASKAHIRDRLNTSDFVVVDTRTDEEYMGWQLYGEPTPGHVKGAVQIPYAWYYNSDYTSKSYAALKSMFESRGVTPDKEVVTYCTSGIRSAYAYFLLRMMGYSRAANYDGSIKEWGSSQGAQLPIMPMEKSPNFATLVYPLWVKQLIDYHASGSTSTAPPEYKDPATGSTYARNHKYLIFETQWGSFSDMAQGWADNAYLLGHIPGAIHSNSDTYENGDPRWFMLPDTELKAAAGSMGITADTTVVIYSDSTIFAARLWWILRYLGVEDIRILNGGYKAWTDVGYAGETTTNSPTATTYIGTTRPEVVATTDYVSSHYNNGTTWMVDVRRWIEYTGEISGYSYVVNKGRIPGAIWAYDADDSALNYNDSDGTLRNSDEVNALWRGRGITATTSPTTFDKEVIFYCGSGYRSALGYLHAYLLGYTNIRNYSDGWEGWSTNYTNIGTDAEPNWTQPVSGRPVESGWPL